MVSKWKYYISLSCECSSYHDHAPYLHQAFITWNKKHSSKQVVSITYTLDNFFFTATTVECLRVVHRFGQIEKLDVFVGLFKSSLLLFRNEDQINTVFVKKKKNFLHVGILCYGPRYEFSSKNSCLTCWLCFGLFLWRTQQ